MTMELETAAGLAGIAASRATQGHRVIETTDPDWDGGVDCVVVTAEGLEIGFQPGTMANARLIAASGPDQWQAVEGLFRAMLVAHRTYDDGLCTCGSMERPCESLAALHPLAEQIIQQLGQP